MFEHGFEPDFPPRSSNNWPPSKPSRRQSPQMARFAICAACSGPPSIMIPPRTSTRSKSPNSCPTATSRLLVGIADVDAYVPRDTAIDAHAAKETTTVYTGVRNFSMLPEMLSTGITSLLENQDSARHHHRIRGQHRRTRQIQRSLPRHCAQQGAAHLQRGWRMASRHRRRPAQGGCLDRSASPTQAAKSSCAGSKKQRFQHGALNIETIEVRPVVVNDKVVDVVKQEKNLATDLIEDFMIAANGTVARALVKVSPRFGASLRLPSDGTASCNWPPSKAPNLPAQPDSKALNDFLTQRKAADPVHFADLSLAVIKLMGPGQYVLERPGDPETGPLRACRAGLHSFHRAEPALR